MWNCASGTPACGFAPAGGFVVKYAAEGAVDTVLEDIPESPAKEETAHIAGFGTFATKPRNARTARNARTGKSVAIAASKMASFEAAKALRESVRTFRKPAAACGGGRAGRKPARPGAGRRSGYAFGVPRVTALPVHCHTFYD